MKKGVVSIMKRFNLTGVCVPDKHYMVDLSEKMDLIVRDYIEQGAYFTINRARQFGKATILSALARRLANDYLVIRLSFEGIDDDNFRDSTSFPNMFVKNVTKRLQQMNVRQDLTETWISTYYDTSVVTDKAFDILGDKITRLCSNADKGVILLVDEVDKSSDNQIFLNFLGMLRNKYLDMQEGLDTSFHNVILAGVYNVKNLQLKLRPEEERRYDSPWNIAAGKIREQHAFDYENNQFVENGELDMEQALRKFQEVMKAEFRSEDTHFLERQGRLLFLCFMKPIINGRGN